MRSVRLINAWIFIVVVLLTATVTFSQGGKLFVKPMSENIRLSPGGKIIGVVLSGTHVEVLERRSDWIKVQTTGWIPQNSLVTDKSKIDAFYIRASHILISTEEETQRILNQIKEGADFEEMANAHSKDRTSGRVGGDLGKFRRGDFSAPFENAAFGLKTGEVSEVVKTDLGFHIIKRTE